MFKVGCQNEFLKWLKAAQEKMGKRTQFLLNSKMVKSFLGRSNSNFGSNQSTSMVGMPHRIITGKFQRLKQGFGFIVPKFVRRFQASTFLTHPFLGPACPPLFKIFAPLPSFLFHPLSRYLRLSPLP